MAFTDQQIATYARQMQTKGASRQELEGFVKSAKSEQSSMPKPQMPTAPKPQQAPSFSQQMVESTPIIGGLAKQSRLIGQRAEQEAQAAGQDIGRPSEAFGGYARGAVKGLGSSIMGAGQVGAGLLQQATKPLQQQLQPIRAVTEPAVSKLGQGPTWEQQRIGMERTKRDLTTPQGLSEKLGFASEQLGEFFAPAGAIAKGVKGTQALTAGSKVPGLARLAPLTVEAILEGASAGAITAAQQGKIDKTSGWSAGIAAAVPVAGAIFRGGKSVIASRLNNSLIKPKQTGFSFGKNPGLEIAKEKISANTMDGLQKKVTQRLSQYSDDLAKHVTKYDDVARNVNAERIINKASDDFTSQLTDPQAAQLFQNKLEQLFGKFKYSKGKLIKTGSKNLDNLKPSELRALQQKVGELTQWTGASYEKPVNKALSKIYTQLGKQLDNVAPGTKVLQRKTANLLAAKQAIKARSEVLQRYAVSGALPTITGGYAAVSGEGDWTERAARGLLVGAATKGLATPAVKTRVASLMAGQGPNIIGRAVPAVISQAQKGKEVLPPAPTRTKTLSPKAKAAAKQYVSNVKSSNLGKVGNWFNR